ncbi:MAG: hypothetical protein IJJ26_09725 [Victivallales bacterium]|nr:hypothetical protein [Victivallales bacterium]
MKKYAMNIKEVEFSDLYIMENYVDFQKGLDDQTEGTDGLGAVYVLPFPDGRFFFSNGNPRLDLDLVLLDDCGEILQIETMKRAPVNSKGEADDAMQPRFGQGLPVKLGFEFVSGTAAKLGLQVGQSFPGDWKPLLSFCCAVQIPYPLCDLKVWNDTSWFEFAHERLRRCLETADDIDALDRIFCGVVLNVKALEARGWVRFRTEVRGLNCWMKRIDVHQRMLAFQCCLASDGTLLQLVVHSWSEKEGFGEKPIAVLHEETFNTIHDDLKSAQNACPPGTLEEELRSVVLSARQRKQNSETPTWKEWSQILNKRGKEAYDYWCHRMVQGILRFPNAEMPLFSWYDAIGVLGGGRHQRLLERLILMGMERQFVTLPQGWEALGLAFYRLGNHRYAFHCVCNEFACFPTSEMSLPMGMTGMAYLLELFRQGKYREAILVVNSILAVGFQDDIPVRVDGNWKVELDSGDVQQPYQLLAALALSHICLGEYQLALMVCEMALENWHNFVASGRFPTVFHPYTSYEPMLFPLICQYRGMAKDGLSDLANEANFRDFVNFTVKCFPTPPLMAGSLHGNMAFQVYPYVMDELERSLLPSKVLKEWKNRYKDISSEEWFETTSSFQLPELFRDISISNEFEYARCKPENAQSELCDALWYVQEAGNWRLHRCFPTFGKTGGQALVRNLYAIHPWIGEIGGHGTVFLDEETSLSFLIPNLHEVMNHLRGITPLKIFLGCIAWDIQKIAQRDDTWREKSLTTLQTQSQGVVVDVKDIFFHHVACLRLMVQFTRDVCLPVYLPNLKNFAWLRKEKNPLVKITGVFQGWVDFGATLSDAEKVAAFRLHRRAERRIFMNRTLPQVVPDRKFNLASLCEMALRGLTSAKNIHLNPNAFGFDLFCSCEIHGKVVHVFLCSHFFNSEQEALNTLRDLQQNSRKAFHLVGIVAFPDGLRPGYRVRYWGFDELENGE